MRRAVSRSSSVLFALVLAGALAAHAQEKRPMSFVDSLELPAIQSPQLSPDGRQILFVIDRPDWKGNRRVGHVYRINADGSGQMQLTSGERGESNPRWAPDGRTIAFTARRDGDQNDQIYLLDTNGGEARRLTNHTTAPANLAWTPDGRSIFFTAADAKSAAETEKDRLEMMCARSRRRTSNIATSGRPTCRARRGRSPTGSIRSASSRCRRMGRAW